MKRFLKKIFRRPVLAFANGLEAILLRIQYSLDNGTLIASLDVIKLGLTYLLFCLFFTPLLFSIINTIKIWLGILF